MSRHAAIAPVAVIVAVVVAGVAALAGCTGCAAPPAAGAGIADAASSHVVPSRDPGAHAAGPRTVTLIHLNDLHAHLTPHDDLVRTADGKLEIVERGGLARTATLIRRIRQEASGSILMNIGDTTHGGVEALFTEGEAVVAPVNALGIDIGVPGNWDFAFGPQVTWKRYRPHDVPPMLRLGSPITPLAFPNLAANARVTLPLYRGQGFLPATKMLEAGGVRVGFIGLTSDIVARMHEKLAFGLEILQGEEPYRELVDRLARELRGAGAEVVVVMSELGIQKDHALAQRIAPGVDFIFSAHTHEATFEPLTSASGALVMEAGNDGWLGRMDVTVTNGVVTAHRWRLLPVGTDLAEDPEIARLVADARRPFVGPRVNVAIPSSLLPRPGAGLHLSRSIDDVVGTTTAPLDRRGALESRFNDAFADALRRQAGTDVAMTPGFRFDAVIPAPGTPLEGGRVASGAVTLEDVYRFFPAPYTLGVARVSGKRLRQILEGLLTTVFSPRAFAQAGGWVDGFSGVSVELDLAGPDGRRIRRVRLDDGRGGAGRILGDDDMVTIAGCRRPFDPEGVLCSQPGFSEVEDLVDSRTRVLLTPTALFIEALASFSSSPPSSPGRRPPTFIDTGNRPAWPATPFVQPLEGVSPRGSSTGALPGR